eukprot:TRINITY_DN438800_c0_g1_i1.p1 TRINITY_DN438800_c0_g1~~TRINITY_DN438800_c0_g1_i1.p1  ORF type:complete len:483 (-),score=88.74 TRINITY_DN438800_c0_g1_i1:227-1675(-)
MTYSMILKVVIAALLFFRHFVLSFDTGHHVDLCNNALSHVGFTQDAIDLVSLMNGATDWFSQSPLQGSRIHNATALLHMDNLFSPQSVAEYWSVFIKNTHDAVIRHKTDPLRLLSIIGISLHNHQDFYAHSNWAEIMLEMYPTKYSKTTYLNQFEKRFGFSNLHTGMSHAYTKSHPHSKLDPHGGYYDGLNKDSYVKDKRWERAHVHAYIATLEWMELIKNWIGVEAFEAASHWQANSLKDKLNKSLELISKTSEFVYNGDNDGHWKGYGSGEVAEETKWMAEMATELRTSPKPFFSLFTEDYLHEELTNGLGKPLVGQPVTFTVKPVEPLVAVVLKTVYFKKENLRPTRPSPYALIQMKNYNYMESPQQHKKMLSWTDQSNKEPLRWTTIGFFTQTEISKLKGKIAVRYSVYNEHPGDDEIMNINSKSKTKKYIDFYYDLKSGNIIGDVSGNKKISTTGQDCGFMCERATVSFEMYTIPIV